MIYLENKFPYLIDIDSKQDLKIANLLVKKQRNKIIMILKEKNKKIYKIIFGEIECSWRKCKNYFQIHCRGRYVGSLLTWHQ